MKYSNAVDI